MITATDPMLGSYDERYSAEESVRTCNTDAEESETAEKTLFFGDVMQALSAAAPCGSTVRAVGFDRADIFLRAGYRTVEGDSDVTVARGGEREFDAARKTKCKKLILCPTHAYAAAAASLYRTQDKIFGIMRRGQKPYAAVFDSGDADENIASLFGEILSLDLAAFDLTFGAYMRGERTDGDLTDRIAKLVSDLTAELKPLEKNREGAKRALTEAGKTAARIVEQRPELLHASGAAQTAEALRMLCAAEDRPFGMRGEIETLLGAYIIDFYIKSLTYNKFDFPPDNNKRIDSVCEYFNADLRRACVYASPIYPPLKMRLCEYRRDEFRSEQMRLLTGLAKRRKNAWQVFKRLYPDDGYGLRSLIDKTDIGICLALAPDVFAADSMLSFLKQTGRLEKYII